MEKGLVIPWSDFPPALTCRTLGPPRCSRTQAPCVTCPAGGSSGPSSTTSWAGRAASRPSTPSREA
eukprot:15459404-Alexandrium_andersonii.AAC.1